MPQFQPNRLAARGDQDLIDEIKRVAETNFGNQRPKRREFDQHSRVHSTTLRKRFGSWESAMLRAGFSPRKAIGTDEMKADLVRMKDRCKGQYFTQNFYEMNGGRYRPKLLKRSFGYPNWQALLQGVLSLRKTSRIIVIRARPAARTNKQLFDELRRVWDLLGRRPSTTEFQAMGRIGRRAYEKQFGSWVKSIEEFCRQSGYSIQGQKGLQVNLAILQSELRTIAANVPGSVLEYSTYAKCGGNVFDWDFSKPLRLLEACR